MASPPASARPHPACSTDPQRGLTHPETGPAIESTVDEHPTILLPAGDFPSAAGRPVARLRSPRARLTHLSNETPADAVPQPAHGHGRRHEPGIPRDDKTNARPAGDCRSPKSTTSIPVQPRVVLLRPLATSPLIEVGEFAVEDVERLVFEPADVRPNAVHSRSVNAPPRTLTATRYDHSSSWPHVEIAPYPTTVVPEHHTRGIPRTPFLTCRAEPCLAKATPCQAMTCPGPSQARPSLMPRSNAARFVPIATVAIAMPRSSASAHNFPIRSHSASASGTQQ